eukprot:jgi/Bigna1/85599/estExt_fgenesh1_pg.C_50034
MRTSRIQSSASLPHFLEPKAFRGGQRLMEPPSANQNQASKGREEKGRSDDSNTDSLPKNTEGSGKQDQPKKIATAAAMNTKNTGEKPSTAEIEAKNTNKKDSSRPFRAPRATRRQRGDGVKRSSLQQLVHNIAQRKEKLDPITVEEVEKHSTAEDAWCIVAGHVLNLNPLIEGKKRHPGGTKILEKIAGKDATSQFRMFHYPHGAAVRWASEEMYVGPLKTDNKSGGGTGGFLSTINPLSMLGFGK